MRRILVVEDEASIRDAYQMILSTEAYLIDSVTNGQEALAKCAEITYDLILLDLMMPVLDGVGFLKKAGIPPGAHTKIILLSNLSTGNELTEALSLGAYKNILKSDLSPRQLLSVVRYELG
jgi:DNA-binding response OmpR family regulator